MSLTVDLHLLQTLPPSLINRDDTGAPKTAYFGGVPRQRVSSQSWKRVTRNYVKDHFEPGLIGYRTKKIGELIVRRVLELDEGGSWGREEAASAAAALLTKAGIKTTRREIESEDGTEQGAPEASYLIFLSPRQIDNAARHILDNPEGKFKKKEALELLNTDHSVDIAMFGRMIADEPTINVDATVQVAHALGIHESSPDFDYYTAVDDLTEESGEAGAGMIGTTQIMSSTLYRFASVDVDSLVESLGDREVALHALAAFVEGFVLSLPTAKQNSFAHNTVPELVYVTVRGDRSVSLVNAFEEPVASTAGSGRRVEGARRLAREEKNLEDNYGLKPQAAFVVGLDELAGELGGLAERITLPELTDRLRAELGKEDA